MDRMRQPSSGANVSCLVDVKILLFDVSSKLVSVSLLAAMLPLTLQIITNRAFPLYSIRPMPILETIFSNLFFCMV